ncbi:MAG: lamin tail domain-containing protein [Ardenticatenaceae bacterium]|nr:lamin tail domain-containing protein [Ardenticatenaceae bacterium]
MKRQLPLLLVALLALLIGFALGQSGFNPLPGPTPSPPSGPAATRPPLATSTPQRRASPTPVAHTTPSGSLPVVVRIVDGDTVQLDTGETVRLVGINTPERNQPFDEEATAFTRQLLLDKPVRVETDVEPRDRYGRTLGYLFLPDGTFANLEIVRNGYAPAWNIEPNSRYRDQFAQAEAEARAAHRGIWAASAALLRIVGIEADPPGPDDENLNGETVTLKNAGSTPVRLADFRLSDRSNTTYIFPDVTLSAGKMIVVHSGRGRDDAGNLYWNSARSIWNNDGDTAFLRDPNGNSVDVYSYGKESP